jgi:hypothetical protein
MRNLTTAELKYVSGGSGGSGGEGIAGIGGGPRRYPIAREKKPTQPRRRRGSLNQPRRQGDADALNLGRVGRAQLNARQGVVRKL